MPAFGLTIITPEGTAFDDEANAIVAPAYEGYLGILAYHAPMICALKPGVLTVRREGGSDVYALGEGVLEVQENAVTILADRLEPARDRDDAKSKVQELTSPWQIPPTP